MSPTLALLISADDLLVADVRRLAAAAGAPLDVAPTAAEGLALWGEATLVLVGDDVLADVAGLGPPRRTGIHVVGRVEPSATALRQSLTVHAEGFVDLPAAGGRVVDLLTDVGDDARGAVIGVLGGTGGAGASVFAAALASVASEQAPALLVDCDSLGAGAERLLGTEEQPGVRWDALTQATGRLSGRSLREALPGRGALSVLGWPADRSAGLDAAVLREVIGAARRGFELTVLDLPRRPDDSLALALLRCDLLVVLAPLTVPGAVATARVAQTLPGSVPATLVLRRGRGATLAPADVESLVGLPVFATMAEQRGLDEAVGLGVGPVRARRGPLARTSRDLLTRTSTERLAREAAR